MTTRAASTTSTPTMRSAAGTSPTVASACSAGGRVASAAAPAAAQATGSTVRASSSAMAATHTKTRVQPVAPKPRWRASSGSTGWIAITAASRGARSPVSAAYPPAMAAVTANVIPAYVVGMVARARPARLTYQAAYPSSTTSSRPRAANVSAVARRPRRMTSGGTARVSSVTTARMVARPSTPKLAHATAVNTIAAAPSSSPPSTNSTFCTVRVDASERPTGTAPVPPGSTGTFGGDVVPGRNATPCGNATLGIGPVVGTGAAGVVPCGEVHSFGGVPCGGVGTAGVGTGEIGAPGAEAGAGGVVPGVGGGGAVPVGRGGVGGGTGSTPEARTAALTRAATMLRWETAAL
ncbi:hypothetical protein ACQP00_10760 [Dactylosporangium sp. CS-047395]|uniref:hypothetical protein n=1 Tax=Dactylosporangium sp. CS-047395 TaxID=3239936 RepID=UPI003D91A216